MNRPIKVVVYKISLISIIILITICSASGIIQTTERVTSSGIIVKPIPAEIPYTPPSNPPSSDPPPSNPPSEPSLELGIYTDSACTKELTSINWGEIQAGGSSTTIFYIKNTGETTVTLGLDTDNWTDDLKTYSTINWNYSSEIILPRELYQIRITLEIDENCPEIDNFHFDIVIIGF